MKQNIDSIDIIIPIYNAYEDLVLCIDSIKKNTNLNFHRLILIDDKSSDSRIEDYLNHLKKEKQNIIVIANKENQGFSSSVNKGIKFSEQDVLLLNSDTIVTKNWIEKIVRCGYSEQSIGTVTPLSNSATLCSFPIFCKDNPLPENKTIDEMALIIEKVSLRRYPTITVAVGFCMFIKRKVIQETGFFDAETFQKGYGEENDFCNRAEQLGYKHVMCDDTFIYHKGTSSFMSEEKKNLIEEHEKILFDRYRSQMIKNQQYCINNPDQGIRDNINIYLDLANGKKNILYLLHLDFREDATDNIGGTQFHVKDLMLRLKKEYNVFVLAREKEFLRLTLYCEKKEHVFRFYIGEKNIYPIFFDKQHVIIYTNILATFHIDYVHIHHTFGLSLDLFYIAKKLGIPLLLTLHDFYYICPTIKLLNNENKYCVNHLSTETCNICLKNRMNIFDGEAFLKKWRKECNKVLKICDKIIVPSESTANIYKDVYDNLSEKIEVIPHGLDLYDYNEITSFNSLKNINIKSDIKINKDESGLISIQGWIDDKDNNKEKEIFLEISDKLGNKKIVKTEKIYNRNFKLKADEGFRAYFSKDLFEDNNLVMREIIRYKDEVNINKKIYNIKCKKNYRKKVGNLNIAFIGGLSPAKGSQLVYDIVKQEKDNVNWYIFGIIDDEKLRNLKQENLIKTGKYEREEINWLIKRFNIDIICILSIWPETFCYTLSEALLMQIPVIVTDIGAIGERVKREDLGWVLPCNASAKDFIEIMQKLCNDNKEYNRVKDNIKEIKLRSLDDMTRDYIGIYNSLSIENKSKLQEKFDYIYKAYLLENLKGNGMEAGESLANQLKHTKEELDIIRSSLIYQILTRFQNIDIPFKSKIKLVLIKILGK